MSDAQSGERGDVIDFSPLSGAFQASERPFTDLLSAL